VTLGAREWVSIPAWGVTRVAARVDTGARTSALHVERLTETGSGSVRFELGALAPGRSDPVEASIARRGRVRSTSGKLETRIFVSARVELGGVERQIELGLVNRSKLAHPMILGRRALAGHFLVDPAAEFLLDRAGARARPHE
jgi:hypothetical protein